MSWSAKQYVAFEDERTRPVRDLLAALPQIEARSVIDIGCGPGNSTQALGELFPHAHLSGIDSSSDMIEAARRRLPQANLTVEDIDTWLEQRPAEGVTSDSVAFDVILANAVLQWLPDHAVLLPALIHRLRPGGALAVQMPDNLDEPAHRLMRELAADGPWAAKLATASQARPPLAGAHWYFDLLRPLCTRVDLWRTTYYHRLLGAAAVVEWFKGSGLRPFLEPLDETERAQFLDRYTAAISLAYPACSDHSVLLPFPRVFLVAIR